MLWRKILKDGTLKGQRVTLLNSSQRMFSDRSTFEQKDEGSKGASCKD